MKEYVVILNAKAGKGKAWIKKIVSCFLNFPLPDLSRLSTKEKIEKIKNEFKESNLEIIETTHKGHATELASEYSKRHKDAIIVVGGDGTLHEVAKGISNETKVAILPAGTANVWAIESRRSFNLEEACTQIKAGEIPNLNKGTVILKDQAEPFYLFASVGLDAQMIEWTEKYLKKYCGALSYVIAAVYVSMFAKEKVFLVEIEGKVYKNIQWAILTTLKKYAGPYDLISNTKEEGVYAVLINRLSLKKVILGALKFQKTKQLKEILNIKAIKAEQIRVISEEDIAYQCDGEFKGKGQVFLLKAEKLS